MRTDFGRRSIRSGGRREIRGVNTARWRSRLMDAETYGHDAVLRRDRGGSWKLSSGRVPNRMRSFGLFEKTCNKSAHLSNGWRGNCRLSNARSLFDHLAIVGLSFKSIERWELYSCECGCTVTDEIQGWACGLTVAIRQPFVPAKQSFVDFDGGSSRSDRRTRGSRFDLSAKHNRERIIVYPWVEKDAADRALSLSRSTFVIAKDLR
jgi:hypothetical protein